MPDEGVLVTMLAHTLGMSRDRYVLSRTRDQFTDDVQGLMKSQLMSMEVLSSMFTGDEDAENPSAPQHDFVNPGEDLRNAKTSDPGNHWDKAGPEMSDPQSADWARRAVKSSQVYNWYKRAPSRGYNVVNLDTRDPGQFKKNVRRFGK
tara:strand:- start:4825 stop:5268 length:444 start_codon:yes stop_codon:yes gene_type:complete